MPRLAIVISAVGSIESMEGTLVSVLENRPADCEIVVALDRPYSDPYALKGEVQFVPAANHSNLVACINQGIGATRSPFVHLLSSGCTVSEGWTEPALARFGDRRIASVAPVVMDAVDPTRILAAGLGYRLGGRRVLIARGETCLPPGPSSTTVGPCGFAAFYRRAALERVGGLSSKLGLAQADVDLALALAKVGLGAVVEPSSRVVAPRQIEASESAFRRALHEERLFWRNLPNDRIGAAVTAHVGLVTMDLAKSVLRPSMLLGLAGRVLACCQIGSHVRHHAALEHFAPVPTA